MLKFFSSSFGDNGDPRKKISFLRCSLLGALQAPPNDTSVESFWNNLKPFLDDVENRFDGLSVLYALMNQCPHQIMEANCYSWFQMCFQTMNGEFPRPTKQLATEVAATIVRRLHEFPAVQKDIAEKLLPFTIDGIIKFAAEEQWLDTGLRLLSVMMSEFQGYCSLRQGEVVAYLFKTLEDLYVEDVEALSNCFIHLPLIGARSCNAKHYSQYWLESVQQLIAALKEILRSLDGWFQTDNRGDVSAGNSMLWVHLSLQFQAVAHCLVKMLGYSRYPVTIPVNRILQVIETPLKLVPFKIQVVAREEDIATFMTSVLPTIQCSSLMILESLILSCQAYILPRISSIGSILCELIVATTLPDGKHGQKSYSERSASIMRIHLYNVLRVWLEKLRPVLSEDQTQNICNVIKRDIFPVIHPTVANPPAAESRKRCSVRAAAGSRPLKMADDNTLISEVCWRALKVLSSLLCCSCTFLETPLLKVVEKDICHLVTSIQSNVTFPVPYNDPLCRLEAYKVLQNVVVSRNISGYLLPAALKLFTAGEKDREIEVSSFCINASRMCGLLSSSSRVITIQVPLICKESVRPTAHVGFREKEAVHNSTIPSIQTSMFGEVFQDMCVNEYENHVPVNGQIDVSVPPPHSKHAKQEYTDTDEEEDAPDEEEYEEGGEEEDEEEEEEEEEDDEEVEYHAPHKNCNDSTVKSRKRPRPEDNYAKAVYEEDETAENSMSEEESEEQQQLSNKPAILDSNDCLAHLSNGLPCAVQENGVNSSASEESDYVVPIKKGNVHHNPPRDVEETDGVPQEGPDDPGSQQNFEPDVSSMLNDFVNCSPDASVIQNAE